MVGGGTTAASPMQSPFPPPVAPFSENPVVKSNGVSVDIELGRVEGGAPAGGLTVQFDTPTNGVFTPTCIKYNSLTNLDQQVISDAGCIAQVKVPEGLVDVKVLTPQISYSLNFYYPSNVGAFSSVSNRFALSGSPYATVTVKNPDATGCNSNKKGQDELGRIGVTSHSWSWQREGERV